VLQASHQEQAEIEFIPMAAEIPGCGKRGGGRKLSENIRIVYHGNMGYGNMGYGCCNAHPHGFNPFASAFTANSKKNTIRE
jgi:hypothetical protein